MARYASWPVGLNRGTSAFAGGVFDGRYIWLVPLEADNESCVWTRNLEQ
jgi:hypothetical protein